MSDELERMLTPSPRQEPLAIRPRPPVAARSPRLSILSQESDEPADPAERAAEPRRAARTQAGAT